MADGFIGTAPDGTGKKLDTTELTVNNLTVERERVVLADSINAAGLARVDAQLGASVNDVFLQEVMINILVELRVIQRLLQEGLTPIAADDLDMIRNDVRLTTP